MLLNVGRCRKVLDECQIDAIVASTAENIAYLTEYDSGILGRPNRTGAMFALVDRASLPTVTFVCPTIHLANVASGETGVVTVRPFGPFFVEVPAELPSEPFGRRLAALLADTQPAAGPLEALAAELQARGLLHATIAVDEMGVAPGMLQELAEMLPSIRIVPGYAIWRRIRAVKSPEELIRIRRAAENAGTGIAAVMAALRPGLRQRDLYRIYREALATRGAAAKNITIACGPGSAIPVAGPTDYCLEAGDLVRFDVGGMTDLYQSGTSRTAILGIPSDRVRRYFAAILAGQRRAIEMARPGVIAREIFESVVQTVRGAGIPHFRRNHVGHGMGIESYDLPLVNPSDETPLEVDMVLNFEPPYYEVGFGGLTVEDTGAITPEGYERFTQMDQELRIIPV